MLSLKKCFALFTLLGTANIAFAKYTCPDIEQLVPDKTNTAWNLDNVTAQYWNITQNSDATGYINAQEAFTTEYAYWYPTIANCVFFPLDASKKPVILTYKYPSGPQPWTSDWVNKTAYSECMIWSTPSGPCSFPSKLEKRVHDMEGTLADMNERNGRPVQANPGWSG